MSKKKSLLSILVFSLLGIVSFQNCNKIQMTDITSEGNGNALAYATPADTPVVMAACNTINRQKVNKSFLFPKPSMTCEWEKSGNLAPRNDYFQGRIEQTEMLGLPAGAIICDVKFNFDVQQFLYDDHFLVTFNDAVVATSYDFSSVLTRKYNLLRYDWTNIVGMNWDNTKEGAYCADGGLCSWPDTDTPGMIKMSYEPIVFQKLMAEDITRINHSLKFISIGDNDDNDCEHSEVKFSLDVEYVVK